MEESENRITPKRVVFGKNSITAKVSREEEYRIWFKDIIWAYVASAPDDGTGLYGKPDIADITDDMDGALVIFDKKRCRWVLRTGLSGQTAGSLLKKLCIHAPYIVAGGQDWFDITQKADFDMVRQMVKVKRACGKRQESFGRHQMIRRKDAL